MLDNLQIIAWATTAMALWGGWLNNRRRSACFAVWIVSNAMSFMLHVACGLWPLAIRDAAFLGLAIHGWRSWIRRPATNT